MKYIHIKKFIRVLKTKIESDIQSTKFYDEYIIKTTFLRHVGYECKISKPISFNEKINWYKLHDCNPLFPSLIDKISVKPIVVSVIGEKYIIKTLCDGYYDAIMVPWTALPDKFVIKCNHDSGSTIVCTDKSEFDIDNAIKKLNHALSIKSSQTLTRASICKYIEPKILVEEYIGGGERSKRL